MELEVAHSKYDISLCQWKYCLDLLEDLGLLGYIRYTNIAHSLRFRFTTSNLFAIF